MNSQTLTIAGWLFIKVLFIIGLAIYALFAFIIVRQEQLMAHVLEEASEPFLKLMAIIHLAAAIFVLLLAILIL